VNGATVLDPVLAEDAPPDVAALLDAMPGAVLRQVASAWLGRDGYTLRKWGRIAALRKAFADPRRPAHHRLAGAGVARHPTGWPRRRAKTIG